MTDMQERKIHGTRILTEERIKNLSNGSLRHYAKAIKRIRMQAHDVRFDYCCEMCREVIREHPLTEEEAKNIRTLDFLWHAITREKKTRIRLGTWN